VPWRANRGSRPSCARVLAAAKKFGYRPNQSARSVKSRRFDRVLFLQLVETADSRIDSGITDGISDGLAEIGRSLVIERLVVPDFLAGGPAPRGLQEMMVDGVLVHGNLDPSAQIEVVLASSGLPVVWVNRVLEHDAAYPDDYAVRALRLAQRVQQNAASPTVSTVGIPDPQQSGDRAP